MSELQLSNNENNSVHVGVLIHQLQYEISSLKTTIHNLQRKNEQCKFDLLNHKIRQKDENSQEVKNANLLVHKNKSHITDLQNELANERLKSAGLLEAHKKSLDKIACLSNQIISLKNENLDYKRRLQDANNTIDEFYKEEKIIFNKRNLTQKQCIYDDLDPPFKRLKMSDNFDSTPHNDAPINTTNTINIVSDTTYETNNKIIDNNNANPISNVKSVVVLSERQLKRQEYMEKKKRRENDAQSDSTAKVYGRLCCELFRRGVCNLPADKCPHSHDLAAPRPSVCKYFIQGLCSKSQNCLFSHDSLQIKQIPCRFFHVGIGCKFTADSCMCSHDDFTSEEAKKDFVRNNLAFLMPHYRSQKQVKISDSIVIANLNKSRFWWMPYIEQMPHHSLPSANDTPLTPTPEDDSSESNILTFAPRKQRTFLSQTLTTVPKNDTNREDNIRATEADNHNHSEENFINLFTDIPNEFLTPL